MNAAFLLVTSALIVGQAADKKVAPPPATPAVAASSCGQSCDCDGFGHRFRGLFNRNSCDSCATTTCHTHHERQPLFRSSCADACQPRWHWEPKCREHKCHEPKCHTACAAPAPTCCDSCGRTGFLTKLRDRFQRSGCCDSGCGTAAPAKAPEKIDTAPKKMPDVKKTTEEVRIETPTTPLTPNVIRVPPTAPTVEVVPVPTPAPRIQGDRRDPF